MEDTPSKLEDHLGYRLRQLSNQVSAAFAERLKKHSVSVPQWVIMRVIFDGQSMPLKEIASRTGVDQGALSRMVERLMALGWVARKEDPADRRRVEISLTADGRQLVPKLAREADENDREFFSALPSPQRRALEDAIQALLATGQGGPAGMALE